jgi:hypothetical protein
MYEFLFFFLGGGVRGASDAERGGGPRHHPIASVLFMAQFRKKVISPFARLMRP